MNKFILLLMIMVVGVAIIAPAEFIARTPYVEERLLPRGLGLDNPEFEVQLVLLEDYIDKYGTPDCIVVGSSIIEHGFNPLAANEAALLQTGRKLECFNFGLRGIRAQTASHVIKFLIDRYAPPLVIWGDAARAFVNVDNKNDEALKNSDWFAYVSGDFNINGWLIDTLHTYQYYLRYRHWQASDFETILQEVIDRRDRLAENGQFLQFRSGYDVAIPTSCGFYNPTDVMRGYLTFQGQLVDVSAPLLNLNLARPILPPFMIANRLGRAYLDKPILCDDATDDTERFQLFYNFSPNADDLAGLEEIIRLNDTTNTRILLVEGYVHSSFTGYYNNGEVGHQVFVNAVRQLADQYGVPFWEARHVPTVPDEFWTDRNHLNYNGSLLYSFWLGLQIAEAIDQGLLENALPPQVLQEPPLKNIFLPNIGLFYTNPFGLSDEHWAAYNNLNLSARWIPPSGEIILNPSGDKNERGLYPMNIGMSLNYFNRDADYLDNSLLFLYLLNRMQYTDELTLSQAQRERLQEWYTTYNPGILRELGIRYLMFTTTWFYSLPDEVRTDFESRYNQVRVLRHTAIGPDYFLYQLQ